MRGVLVFVVGSALVAVSASAQAPRLEGPFAVLVDLVATDAPDAVRQAEAAHAALSKEGQPPVASSYALALVCVRVGHLDQAAQVLDALPTQAKYAPPVLRLRLYLAIERDEPALAARLVPMIKDQALGDQSADQEKVQSARLLGGIIGATAAGETRMLPEALVNATVSDLSSAADANVKSAFRLAQSEAAKRREKMAALVAASREAAGGQKILDEAVAEQAKTAAALEAAKEKLTATIRDNKDADGEAKGKLRQLSQHVRDLEREWKLETPGRPRQPMKPKEPVEPRRPSGKNDQSDYDRAMDRYRAELRDYRRDLAKYNEDLRTYQQRLENWQQQDKARREKLQAERKQTDDEIGVTRKAQKDRDQAEDDVRDEIKRHTAAAQELDAKVTLLRAIASGAATKEGWLSRPSHYGLLSFSAERQRLLQAKP